MADSSTNVSPDTTDDSIGNIHADQVNARIAAARPLYSAVTYSVVVALFGAVLTLTSQDHLGLAVAISLALTIPLLVFDGMTRKVRAFLPLKVMGMNAGLAALLVSLPILLRNLELRVLPTILLWCSAAALFGVFVYFWLLHWAKTANDVLETKQ